tara:strand:+ start:945 stop:2687 length:1743 start_codon:yes stop_codon:yes gene_type:complete
MIKKLNSKIENSQIKVNDDEIDLKIILNFILRNKLLIGLISFVALIFGILYSFTLKEVWEGQFQIVLNKSNESPNINPQLANLAGINQTKVNELKTEVEILKSPSVLMPVFDFAKSQKNQSLAKNLRFSDWKKSLNIRLKNGTSVLNISYKNTSKESIIPVLNKIGISYQQYSGKNKRRNQELTNNFLKEQISLFKKKSANSLRAAQEYAIDQDLVYYDFGKETQNNIDNNSKDLTSNALVKSPNLLLSNIGIENARVQAANQIRKINLQLQKIQELNNSEELQYIGSTIPALVDEGLPGALSDIEATLLEERSKYTDKDIVIVNLIKKRNLTIDLLKNRTIKYLEVQKLNAEATMKAAMRPKGVLLKYKELIRESAREEQTLIQLEDKLNLLKLDLASQEDPWELITNPTLLETRLSPNRKKLASLSLIVGFILGIAVAIFKEKKSGQIYDASVIKKLIPIKLISEININTSEININSIEIESQNFLFIKDLLDTESNNVVNFVPLGNIEEQELAKLKDFLMKEKFKKEIKFSSNKAEIKEYSNYLILKLGYVKYSDIYVLKKRLELLENIFNGMFVLA